MQNLMKRIDCFSTQLNIFVYKLTGILILVQFGIVLYGVFFRYFLNNPLSWVLPVSRIILVWTGLLGISIAFKEGEHVALDFIVLKFPLVIQKIILLIGYILIVIYLFILVWKGFPIALQSTQLIMITEKLQIPLTWSIIAIPIGAAVNLIHIIPIPLLIRKEIEERDREKNKGVEEWL